MFGDNFMYVNRKDKSTIEVHIPIIVKYDVEERYLVEQAQRIFTTGILINGFALDTIKYSPINNECYVIGQISSSPALAVSNLLNYLKGNNIKAREEVLECVLAMLSGIQIDKMSEYVIRTNKKHTKVQILEMDSSIYSKVYRMLPDTHSNVGTVSVNVDFFHLQALRPITYNLYNDIEIWQSVSHCVRCGLYFARLLHNSNSMNKVLLVHTILAILHISQQTIGLLGK